MASSHATKIHQTLVALKAADEKHAIIADTITYSDMVACDYSDNEVAKIVVKWNEAYISLPKRPGSAVPIGLVQIDIPYEHIYGIVRFKIQSELLDEIPDAIKYFYKNTNIEEVYDVSEPYVNGNTSPTQP
jgi:hypothetical protein